MVWCTFCQEDWITVGDPDNGYICCTGCGKVIVEDIFVDEPTKDSSGLWRDASRVISCESSYSVSRERTSGLLGRHDVGVTETARCIVASMKRGWMQTGRKPSGICGAAIYISAVSHGLTCSKSDIMEEFLTRAEQLKKISFPSQLRPGEVLCEHNDHETPHFADGICKTCFMDLYDISGGLDSGAEPPAFQRAERQRIERAHEQEKMNKEEMEAGVPKIDSDSTRYKSMASKEHEILGHQVADTSACDGQPEFENSAEKAPESLSDIDDSAVDVYLHKEETQYKQIIWEEMNNEYLEEQAAKEAIGANGELVVKPEKKRKQRTAEEAKNSTLADTPLEATCQMLKKKTFSSRVKYEALESLHAWLVLQTDDENVNKQEGEPETGDANGKVSTIQKIEKPNGDVTGKFEDLEEIDDYGDGGNEDGDYTYDGFNFEDYEEA